MNYIIKTISFFLLIAVGAVLLLVLPQLDWQNDWLIPTALGSTIALLFLAMVNFKNFILLLILALPTTFYLNDVHININKILPLPSSFSVPLNLSGIILFLIIFFGLLTLILDWRRVKTLPLKIIFFSYTIFCLTSLAWTYDYNASFMGLTYFLPPVFIYIIAYSHFSDKKDFLKLIFISLLAVIGPLAISLAQLVQGHYFFEPDSSLGRLQGPFNHPNILGLFIFVIIAITTAYYLAKNNRKLSGNFLLLGFTAVNLFVLAFTFSRVSWGCLGLFILLLIFWRRESWKFSAVLTVFGLVLILIFSSITTRVNDVFSDTTFNSLSARQNIWKVAYGAIMTKPLLGFGVGTSEKTIELTKTWPNGSNYPHNDIILYGLELGIIGILFFIAYTAGLIYYAGKTFQNLPDNLENIEIFKKNMAINFKTFALGILLMLIALLLSSLFESVSRRIATEIIIYALLGSLFALKKNEPAKPIA